MSNVRWYDAYLMQCLKQTHLHEVATNFSLERIPLQLHLFFQQFADISGICGEEIGRFWAIETQNSVQV